MQDRLGYGLSTRALKRDGFLIILGASININWLVAITKHSKLLDALVM